MLLQKPNDLSNKSSIERNAADVGFVHDRLAFASILRLERMRSDRSGTAFALAMFSFHNESDCDLFVSQLVGRRRATDHIGRMGRGKVGVVLWNTASDGAWKFADLATAAQTVPFTGRCEIYVYPTRNLADADATAQRHVNPLTDSAVDELPTTERQNRSAGQATAACLTDSLQESATTVRTEHCLALTEKLIGMLTQEEERPPQPPHQTQSLETLLAQPLPVWKRTLDIAGATLGLILLSPLFATVAVCIKLTSAGPVLFCQRRSGRGGIPFTMYKFRSMVADAEQQKQQLLKDNEQDGPAFKMETDPRITTIGHIIRRTSIDELPQLWNVLRGEMSLVGPRPLPCAETEACEAWQKRRLDVTPGLTCIWQVQDRRTKIPFADWARMDIRYIGSRTLRNDVSLVLKTFRSIFGRKGS